MAQDNTPLDERLHSDHMQNAWYMGQLENSEFQFPFMSDNMLHHYFAASPFFDWTTKNGSEIKQCQQDPYGWQWSHNRKAFEQSIASRNGQEYMIVEGEGMEFDKEGKPVKGGVWVIRKQERRKGADKGKDALETLATYYIVGESVYQAPSVGDILGTRLLSASTALNKVFSQAATLPQWSPTTGHTYPTSSAATTGSKHPATSGSTTAGSTPRSREGSVSTDFRANSSAPAGSSSSHGSSDALSNRLLTDSLKQSFTYADDPFTDENPLQGEPGSLTFVATTARVKQRKADAKAAAAATKAKEESLAAAVAAAAAEAASKPATPVAASPTTPGKVVKKTKEKKKRRKSRHDAQSPPMSPVGGTPVGTPGPTSSG